MINFVSCTVVELNAHPQATKLKVAKVTDGINHFTVVCGAKNIRVNMQTVLAKIGATTHQGTIIQESSIRGVLSQGMLCSPLELGVSQEQGIIDLPPKTKPGTELKNIPQNQLSSTPWWDYQLIERFYSDDKNRSIHVQRDQFEQERKNHHLISETYWFNGQYHYRQF